MSGFVFNLNSVLFSKIPLAKAVFFVVDITHETWNQLGNWIFEASEAILGLNNEKTALV